RRFWEAGTLPSDAAALAGGKALAESGVSPESLQALLYCGVSHDFVEPATSTAVVSKLGLGRDILNFDISNACLGVISGIMMLASAIESGLIQCGMAVTGENAGPLVENTVRRLNADLSITRNGVKDEFASLTIGSGAAAVIVCRRGLYPGHRLLASATASDCSNNALCQGDAAGGMTDGSMPVMKTDSQQLLIQGVQVASRMWQNLRREECWQDGSGLPSLVCGHQVGRIHRDRLFEALGLPLELDFPTFPELGNCGSAALPMCCALAAERGALKPGTDLAMLGIGSGINSAGLAVRW
ncbi:MAG: 3-oxoacyl-ACP synthase III, partial [Victivallales bacterium]|nr:3-oxoacyl-ACP synthase III [Victivallales bacterium]